MLVLSNLAGHVPTLPFCLEITLYTVQGLFRKLSEDAVHGLFRKLDAVHGLIRKLAAVHGLSRASPCSHTCKCTASVT